MNLETLVQYRLLIDGQLVAGATTLGVVNPAAGQDFAVAPRANLAQAEQAVAAAKRAFPGWAAVSYSERRSCLERFADAINSRAEEFSATLTREQGPLSEATMLLSALPDSQVSQIVRNALRKS